MSRSRVLIAACLCWLGAAGLGSAQEFLGKPLSEWRDDLSSPKASARQNAAYAIGKMGIDASSSIPRLVALLDKESNAGVKAQAATSIGEISLALGSASSLHWQTVGGMLMSLLQDPDPMVRRGAAYALGTFDERASTAKEALQRALKDDQATVRQNAAWALGRIGGSVGGNGVDALCSVLTDSHPLVRRDAIHAIGKIGLPAAKLAVEPLLNLVKTEAGRRDPDEVVLKSGLEKLVDLVGPEQKASAGTLHPLLQNADAEVQRLTAFVLAKIDLESARPAIPVLRQALANKEDALGQELAAGAMAKIFEEAHRQQSPNFGLQRQFEMSKLFPDVVTTAQALREALKADRPAKVRINAAVALGHIGPEAKGAVDELRKAIDPNVPVVIGEPQSIVRQNMARLQLRLAAAEALALFSYNANADALRDVLAILKNKNEDTNLRVRCVWSFFEAKTPEIFEHFGADKVMTDVLFENDPNTSIVRYETARVMALTYRANAPDKTVDVLLDMLQKKDLKVFEGTGADVKNVGTSENRGGNTKVAAKQSGDGRFMAAEALGLLGAKGNVPRVIDALKKATSDSDPLLKEKATEALQRLQG